MHGSLLHLLAAYNAGEGRLQGWLANELEPAADDPLLFIESVPISETRGYLKKVLANLWAYQALTGETSPSLRALAENRWPEVDPVPRPKRQAGGEGDVQCPGELTRPVPFQPLRIAVLTVSDTRTIGRRPLRRHAGRAHRGRRPRARRPRYRARRSRRDRGPAAAWIADPAVEVVITTGGTGVTGRDVTPEALARSRRSTSPASASCSGCSATRRSAPPRCSRAPTRPSPAAPTSSACRARPGACRDGWDEILRFQLDIRHRPCNFAELIPRLQEHEA